MEWLIAILRKLVSYEARAAAIRQDRQQLMVDIEKAIEAKEARIHKLEKDVLSLGHIQGTY